MNDSKDPVLFLFSGKDGWLVEDYIIIEVDIISLKKNEENDKGSKNDK